MEDQERQNYLKRALITADGSAQGDAAEHLTEAEAFAFYQGQLAPELTGSKQKHLLGCAQCQQLFAAARAFSALAESDEAEIGPAQIQASWEQVKMKLPLRAVHASAVAVPTQPKAMATAASGRWWGVLLTLGILGGCLAIWSWQATRPSASLAQLPTATPPTPVGAPETPKADMQSQPTTILEPAAKPSLNTAPLAHQESKPESPQPYFLGELAVLTGDRAAGPSPAALVRRIPAEARSFSLKLKKYAPREFPNYQVDLLDAQSAVRQTVTGAPGPDNLIEVAFTCAGLSSGEYGVRVHGVADATDSSPVKTEQATYEARFILEFAGK